MNLDDEADDNNTNHGHKYHHHHHPPHHLDHLDHGLGARTGTGGADDLPAGRMGRRGDAEDAEDEVLGRMVDDNVVGQGSTDLDLYWNPNRYIENEESLPP